MSKHSSIHESKPKDQPYNINQSAQPSNLGSAKKSLPHNDNPQKEWVATYIDGQYFLADPDAMNKLKIIEAQLLEEKNKLALLEHENIDNNNSFLSLQEQKEERLSNKSARKSVCNTEFIPTKHINNQQKVKQELESEEEKYKQKIKNMQNQRVELKKNMVIVEQKEKTKKNASNEIEKSNKKSVRPQSKQKSYHKSKLQKSIHQSSNIQDNAIIQNLQVQQKSVNQKAPSQKPKSVMKQKSMKIQKSVKGQTEVKSIQGNDAYEVNVIEAASQSSADANQNKTSKAKQQSTIKNQIVGQPQKSQKSNLKSHKNVQSEKIQHLDIKSKHSKVLQEDNKSKKTTKSVVVDDDIKSKKSKINELIQLDDQKSKKSQAVSRKQQQIQEKEVITSKKSHLQLNNVNNDVISHKKSSKADPILTNQDKEDVKSKVSSAVIKQKLLNVPSDQKSQKSSSKHQEQHFDDNKSKKSINEQAKSRKQSNYDEKSHKQKSNKNSYKPSQHDEASIKQKSIANKSQKSQKVAEDKDQLDNNHEIDHRLATKPLQSQYSIKSKHVSEYQKQKLQKAAERSAKSRNSNQKSSKVQQIEKKDQSIQYSRLTENKQSNEHINQIKFKEQSQSGNNYFVNNESSVLKESSHYEKQQTTQRLAQDQIQKQPQVNMKKNKQNIFAEPYYQKTSNADNKSEKKSKSFIIHSRHGSVKQKTQKNYEKLNNSKYSSRKSSNSQFINNNVDDTITKHQIVKLNQQILLLQQKLQKVQEKQQQMQKYESINSKLLKNQSQIYHVNEPQVQQINIPQLNIPQVKLTNKAPVKLQIQSSTINVNTHEDIRKKQEKQKEINEKATLKNEIDRLRKIIRDMQIEKIKSIDHENQLGQSELGLKKLNSKGLENDGKESRQIEKESLHSLDSPTATQKRFYGSGAKNKADQFGKIIKNNLSYLQAVDKKIQTPRKRSNFKLPYHVNDQQPINNINNDQLLNESNKRATFKNKFYSEVRRNDLIDRLNHNSSRDSHNFIESNKIIAQDGYKVETTQVNQNNSSHPFNSFSRIAVQNNKDTNGAFNKVNFSRMVEYMKKTNPEQEEILPEIHLRDIKVPNLPNCPHADMTQDQLLQLAKITYQAFGVNIDEEDRQLCVKKYKNCVIFNINNQTHQCILWHFSGKFYMGGWKSGQPGQGEKNGEGIEIIPDKHVYRGQFLNGKKNGTGILKMINGNLYDGQWIQGVKNGRGVYLDAATKVIYSGQWRDGKKDGQGYLKLSDKEYYYGTFIKSVKQGYGVQVFVNGDRYKGQYKNGKFHGKGKYIWANESCYQGQFNQGVRYGQGSWKSAKNNADIYIGTYLNDKKNGYGRYVWANGCIYEGGFVNDVKHGKGRLTYQDGKQIKGVWQQGNLISTDTQKKIIDSEQQPLRRSLKVSTFGYQNSGHKMRMQ